MNNYLINEIINLNEERKLYEMIENENIEHLDIFTDEEINRALELKRKNKLHDELNRVNIMLEEDQKIFLYSNIPMM
ncbi:MAG: hypothetical protein ACQEQE_01650 [Bacillota bacterium]